MRQTRKLSFEDLNGADVHVELVDMMLAKVAQAEAAMSMMDTSDRSQFSEEDLQQCCLTSSISTNLDIITKVFASFL